jgi:hypothetical protein
VTGANVKTVFDQAIMTTLATQERAKKKANQKQCLLL